MMARRDRRLPSRAPRVLELAPRVLLHLLRARRRLLRTRRRLLQVLDLARRRLGLQLGLALLLGLALCRAATPEHDPGQLLVDQLARLHELHQVRARVNR